MKKIVAVTWAIVFAAIIIPALCGGAGPVGSQHVFAGCGSPCHANHVAAGMSPAAVYDNICQTCHQPGDANAGTKPLSPGDASLVFSDPALPVLPAGTTKQQTSHRWNGSATNYYAGAQPPVLAAMTSIRSKIGDQLSCESCHRVHGSDTTGRGFLRTANDQDQMCQDCHRSRVETSPLKGTHPVNVNYNDAVSAKPGKYKVTPENANPANPTSNLRLSSNGNVVCSTCHGVHYADSRSSTFDGASSAKGNYNYANLSSGDGYLLRTDRRGPKVPAGQTDRLNICMNCHAGKMNHNAAGQDIQCTECHGAHTDYDPEDLLNVKGRNVSLIRRYVSIGGVAGRVFFRYTGSHREYSNPQGTGICQGCHGVPPPGGKYPAEHSSPNAGVCNTCHSHGNLVGSFSAAYDLTITRAGSGTGNVGPSTGNMTPSTRSITWNGNIGTVGYLWGANVDLTATPNGSDVFTGWSGCDSVSGVNNTVCSVTMSAAKNVTANFSKPPDFTMTGVPINIVQGETRQAIITLTALYDFNTPVTITWGTLPSSATASISPSPVTPASAGASSLFTLTAGSSTPVGSSNVRLTATDGALTRFFDIPVTVYSPPVLPTLSIGAPSSLLTRNSDVSYTVTYSNQTSITLNPADITVNKTGTATNSSVTVTPTGVNTRTVTLGGLSGDGTLGISIAADTARDSNTVPNKAAANGPSATFQVDNTAPTVAITNPPKLSSQAAVYVMNGTASDTGSGISKVELQITDGAYCFAPNALTMLVLPNCNTPWFVTSGTTSWVEPLASTINALLIPGTNYTIRARATDAVGNVSPDETVSRFTKVTQIFKEPTYLTMDLSDTSVPNNWFITVGGILSRYCSGSCGSVDLSGRKITISVRKGGAAIGSKTIDVYTTSELGHYANVPLGPFTEQGSYTIEASFTALGATDLQPSSITKILTVGKPAGYAIIIEGKLTADPAGIPAHTKSARRAYKALKDRNFTDANIYWFNQGPATDPDVLDVFGQPVVLPVRDTSPTKEEILDILSGTTPYNGGTETLADLMKSNPAPLYLIMVDHGSQGKFHLGKDSFGNEVWITPAELDSWLAALDLKLDAPALAEKKILVIGACYSGSFIPALSRNGRVIVTSASEGEQSYRGGIDGPDNVQSGEYFLDEFFAGLRRRSSIHTAFNEAAEKTWLYTRAAFSGTNSVQPSAAAAQHPLLDDNGDGIGNLLLTDVAGSEGSASASLYLGVAPEAYSVGGPTSPEPSDLSQVARTIYIDANQTTLPSPLWATSSRNYEVSTAWVELLSPATTLSGNGSSIQLTRLTDRNGMNAVNDCSTGHSGFTPPASLSKTCFDYSGFSGAIFTTPGRYEATYYAINKNTGNPSPSRRTVVYVDLPGNGTPIAPTLVEPDVNGQVPNPIIYPETPPVNYRISPNTRILFKWNAGSDDHAITYKLEVCTDSSFTQNCFVKDEIIEPFYLAGSSAGLQNGTRYYWRVWTVDAFGARKESLTYSFTTANQNAMPGFIQGVVTRADTGAAIKGASVTAGSSLAPPTPENGAFAFGLSGGSAFQVNASATGYTSGSSSVYVSSGATVSATIPLTPVATCGTNNKGSFDTKPTANLCVTNKGTPSAVSDTTPWTWTCTYPHPSTEGVSVNCSAYINRYPLNLTYSGSGGSGNVNGTDKSSGQPVGINCTSGSCPSVSLDYGKVITLTEAPDSQSVFGGWIVNGVPNAITPLDVTMNGTQNVLVLFDMKPPFWQPFWISPFPVTLTEAFSRAATNSTIMTKAVTITENVVYDQLNKTEKLQGGFDASYGTNPGYTAIKGSLTIKNGILRVERVVVN